MDIKHTDLALEAAEIYRDGRPEGEIDGARLREKNSRGFAVTEVTVFKDSAAKELCKPKGNYITVDIGRFLKRGDGSFPDAVEVIGGLIREQLGGAAPESALVAGLGNRAVTPDVVGPAAADMVLATRHLVESSPEDFPFFNKVSVISPGVVGTTGIDSGSLIKAAADMARPAAVIVVDALCSASPDRLCKTVQVTNTGIIPGSGVGNAGSEISEKTMGVPVIAIGAPTVMSLKAAADVPEGVSDMFVTPRDIDIKAAEISKLIAYSINYALHKNLSVSDIDMLV